MQTDRRVVADAWLTAASRDQRAAERLRDLEPSLACFHAQQSAENALKAATVVASGDVQRSHSLVRALRELTAAGTFIPETILQACRILERYYASTRYPDALGNVDPGEIYTLADALETFALASEVIAFSRTIVVTA